MSKQIDGDRITILWDRYQRIPYGQEVGRAGDIAQGLCPTCSTRKGELHAENCNAEQCPRCRGPLHTCNCEELTDSQVKPASTKQVDRLVKLGLSQAEVDLLTRSRAAALIREKDPAEAELWQRKQAETERRKEEKRQQILRKKQAKVWLSFGAFIIDFE
jgi:hypothetical protein